MTNGKAVMEQVQPGEGMDLGAAMAMIIQEVYSAQRRYPLWPSNLVMAAAIAEEESGEVVKECNTYHWKQGPTTLDDIRKEAIQAAAMWIRFLVDTPEMGE
jgi:hypothetical protein